MIDVAYYDQDFQFEEYLHELVETQRLLALPEIGNCEERLKNTNNSCETAWNDFFGLHVSGQMYKPRRYIVNEFRKYFSNSSVTCLLEVGSGYGCTMFPILEAFPLFRYIATDISSSALTILQSNPKSAQSQISTYCWNLLQPPGALLSSPSYTSPDLILSIFTLSALPPADHLQAFLHLNQILQSSKANVQTTEKTMKYILFRDYGVYDMTMFKHSQRREEFLFQRIDGTLCYYFSLEYLRQLIESIEGMVVVELSYATVINHNRKTKEKMHRVFVHGVFGVEI
jgi:hypothetical protein